MKTILKIVIKLCHTTMPPISVENLEQVKVEFIYLMSISSGISNVVYSWAAQVKIMLSAANLIRHKYKK